MCILKPSENLTTTMAVSQESSRHACMQCVSGKRTWECHRCHLAFWGRGRGCRLRRGRQVCRGNPWAWGIPARRCCEDRCMAGTWAPWDADGMLRQNWSPHTTCCLHSSNSNSRPFGSRSFWLLCVLFHVSCLRYAGQPRHCQLSARLRHHLLLGKQYNPHACRPAMLASSFLYTRVLWNLLGKSKS